MLGFAPFFGLQWLRGRAVAARRQDRTWRYVAWSAVAGVANAVSIVFAISFLLLFWAVGLWPIAAVLAVVLITAPLAATLVRHVFVPAGWVRAAYHVSQYNWMTPDAPALGLCIAAWACRTGEDVTWVEALRDKRTPLGDGEIAATALLAAHRGDLATARALLHSLAMILENHPAVRELASEWLACDAAERGAWRELVGDAPRDRGPATPLGFLLEGIAARHVGAAGAPATAELWGRWLVAPCRRATYPLVRAALVAEPPAGDAPSDAAAAPVPDASPLVAAITGQLAFETQPATAARLATAVGAWDAALADDATRTWLARRALELDAAPGAVDRAIADVAAAVTDDLTRLAEAAQLGAPPGAGGPVGHGVLRRLRHGRLDDLEAGFVRWGERRHGAPDRTGARAAIDEWREFVALWSAYNAAVAAGGLGLRRLAFPQAFSHGNHMAAWLWNKREEYVISHAISKWLLGEARIVGDTEAIELGHRNCALVVPTRLGRIQDS